MNQVPLLGAFGHYDFGLSAQEEARAARLHSESIVIDLLLQGPCTYLSFTPDMEKEINEHYEATDDPDLTMLKGVNLAERLATRDGFPQFKKCWDESGLTAGCRQVEMGSWELMASTFSTHIAMFDHLPWMIKALRADDIRRAKAEGKHAAWLSTQVYRGVEENFVDLIEEAYDMGLRLIQLTYNTRNLIACGCGERKDVGVSDYGVRVIKRMNEWDIIVDTSHCGPQTTLEACEHSTAPVVATHTSAQGVYHHVRAKNDEEIRAIAATGGVIGIVTLPFFLAPTPLGEEKIGLKAWLDHVDYIADLVGWQHVAIGTDWPMSLPKSTLSKIFMKALLKAGFRREDLDNNWDNLIGFDDYRDFPNLTRGLVKRGYTDEQIKGILGENFLGVFEGVCG